MITETTRSKLNRFLDLCLNFKKVSIPVVLIKAHSLGISTDETKKIIAERNI